MAQEQPAPFPDTAHFLDAANDSARNFRAVYVTYLIIAFYIIAIISSTDDELLFRAGNVQMPIINTSVPVVWFFIVAPWILFLLHLNLLMQAVFLSTKVHRYTSRLANEENTCARFIIPRNAGAFACGRYSTMERAMDFEDSRLHLACLVIADHFDIRRNTFPYLSKRVNHLVTPHSDTARHHPAVVPLATHHNAPGYRLEKNGGGNPPHGGAG